MGKKRSTEERIGAIVLLPFRLLLALIAVAILLLLWIPVGVCILIFDDGSLKDRIVFAVFWPLVVLELILGINDLLSLNGMDHPTLSRISRFLSKHS